MPVSSTKAKRMPLEQTVSKAPGGLGDCVFIQIECGMQPGDTLSIGRYPDGDYVFGIVHKGEPATIVLAPEAMKDVVESLFKLVQS